MKQFIAYKSHSAARLKRVIKVGEQGPGDQVRVCYSAGSKP